MTDFKTDPDSIRGTIDIPVQGVKEMKLIHISSVDGKVYFELASPVAVAIFEGIFSNDSLKGKFMQAGMEGTFYLVKSVKVEEIKTDTTVTETLPYSSEEVTFTNDGITFAGTLTVPFTKGKHPAVIMITGSGPQTRDEEILGFKIFKIIADHFTRNGIAVLRYDDRGVGGTKGKSVNESTTEDFAGDVLAAVQYLKSREDINPSQIGLCGHSEGGIVAPLAASKSTDVAFIVLIAGTGVNGFDIIREQSKLILEADKTPVVEVEGYLKMLDLINETISAGKDLSTIREQIEKNTEENYEKLKDEEKKAIKDKDEYIKTTVNSTIYQFSTPWMKYFLKYDPAPALEKVKCPVLMLFGEKDLQVPPHQNKGPMENALQKGGNKDYRSVVLPSANHLFQQAETGSSSEYPKLPKEFVPGFLDTMSTWVIERVTVVK